ncbi:MAG: M20/M25/M40 family metallo-hydrolase [Helicobacteraceae bacterium]|nr:M20/M25/M40 family metallo-hydrolase [Helicobacteraceae bacterium]
MKALDIFYEICKIPHNSTNTKKLQDFIIDFAKNVGCKVSIDKANNIHLLKGSPKICLQAHYDMVLIGSEIVPFIDKGILKSRDSSLGADNGAGVAAILALCSECKDFEALITNDEEIGMIGANNLDLKIKSKKILNLDSEDINEICVGCAGGFDVDIKLKPKFKKCKFKHFYQLKTLNFVGGHSGIDINKNIKNAIVELLMTINRIDCEVINLNGGEKRNSIPCNAKAIIATKYPLEIKNKDTKLPTIKIKKINKTYKNSFSKKILKEILTLHSGVYAIDCGNTIDSLNISMIDNSILKAMARANRLDLLERKIEMLKTKFGKNIRISGIYLPWEREDSTFLKDIEKAYKKHKIDYKIIEIHAGLECGILKQKYNIKDIFSIGPTILNPHSKQESLNLKSFEIFYKILKDLIKI